jgi:hypothetical protein
VESKKGRIRGVKYWEILAENLSKAGFQQSIVKGAQSGLRTHIATTESVSLRVRMKN